MSSFAKALNKIFGWGIYLCLFAGGITFFGFLAALIIGGEAGEALAIFVHKQYFPVVIRITSLIILVGLINMYMTKQQALSLTSDKAEAEADIELAKELEKD